MTTPAQPVWRNPFTWWVAALLALMAAGLAGGVLVMTRGLVVTNLTDLVPWGLWITLDLSAIALSAGAFTLSAAVYLLGLKAFQPVARTAVFIGLIGYSVAILMLLLDIGRPDRFWHGLVFWNIHSPLWEVTMCVALYFTVLVLEVTPIVGGADWFQRRWPRLAGRMTHLHHHAPYLAVAGLGLSMLHQSSLGATYGILKARPYWYQPGLAVMFMVSAIAGGLALTVLVSSLAAKVTPRAVVQPDLLDRLAKVVGWVLIVYLYMRVWELLSSGYTYEPARSEAWKILTSGSLAANFWGGEMVAGAIIPAILLLSDRWRCYERFRLLALTLVVAGIITYRWDVNLAGQLVVFTQLPHTLDTVYTTYVPSWLEMVTGVGALAYGLLAFSLGVRYLHVVDHRPAGAPAPLPPITSAPPILTSS